MLLFLYGEFDLRIKKTKLEEKKKQDFAFEK